ncbi:MAG: arsenate reductase ArsC [Thermoanaerobaculia bacterium]|nr:arsenate reductase ArsC [Thermoanaerobaculia bacterium]
MTPKKKILFLCTGNAARSQMGEALARLDWGDVVEPVSAGSKPAGWVHPLAIDAMEELGADMSQARSKPAGEFMGQDLDLVVTLCDSAANDCPVWPGAKQLAHKPVEDPSFGDDDPATRYDRFLERRDEIRQIIAELMREMGWAATEVSK